MPRVHEEEGCLFYIYTNDHEPPYVHIKVGDGIVQIYLDDQATIKQQWRVRALEVKKARRITLENPGKLMKEWSRIHGKA